MGGIRKLTKSCFICIGEESDQDSDEEVASNVLKLSTTDLIVSCFCLYSPE